MKEKLKTAFNAPAPTRKTAFLSSINYPKITRVGFILSQAGYIRKHVWAVTFLMIAFTVYVLFSYNPAWAFSDIGFISSLLPFAALVGMTEIARSASYNMAELEMSCKYSFSDIVLARLGILSGVNLVLIAGIIAVLNITSGVGVLRLTAYLLVPFLLTCALSLCAINRMRAWGVYVCGAISGFVSIFNLLFTEAFEAFDGDYLKYWGTAFCVLLIYTMIEIHKLIHGTEDAQWNLSLTA